MCDCYTSFKLKRESSEQDSEWNYTDQEQWKTYKDYYNIMKTPINIQTDKTICSKNNLKIKYSSLQTCSSEVNDHYVIYKISDDSSFIMYNNNKYILKQFHFHNSSENTIDSVYYPIECHFINEYVDDNGNSNIIVIALMMVWGNNGSDITSNIISNIGKTLIFDLSVYNDLTKTEYYNFTGSLSSPPFTPNYNWNVFKPSYKHNINYYIDKTDYDDYLRYYSNNKANELSYYNINREKNIKYNFLAIKTVNKKK
jgi:carbonic anhydrase